MPIFGTWNMWNASPPQFKPEIWRRNFCLSTHCCTQPFCEDLCESLSPSRTADMQVEQCIVFSVTPWMHASCLRYRNDTGFIAKSKIDCRGTNPGGCACLPLLRRHMHGVYFETVQHGVTSASLSIAPIVRWWGIPIYCGFGVTINSWTW